MSKSDISSSVSDDPNDEDYTCSKNDISLKTVQNNSNEISSIYRNLIPTHTIIIEDGDHIRKHGKSGI